MLNKRRLLLPSLSSPPLSYSFHIKRSPQQHLFEYSIGTEFWSLTNLATLTCCAMSRLLHASLQLHYALGERLCLPTQVEVRRLVDLTMKILLIINMSDHSNVIGTESESKHSQNTWKEMISEKYIITNHVIIQKQINNKDNIIIVLKQCFMFKIFLVVLQPDPPS